jgi:hypothetical protein
LHTSQICYDFFEVWLIRRELKLDEETRWQITGEIEGLRQHGEWEWLDEEAPMRALAPGSGPHDRREKIKPE